MERKELVAKYEQLAQEYRKLFGKDAAPIAKGTKTEQLKNDLHALEAHIVQKNHENAENAYKETEGGRLHLDKLKNDLASAQRYANNVEEQLKEKVRSFIVSRIGEGFKINVHRSCAFIGLDGELGEHIYYYYDKRKDECDISVSIGGTSYHANDNKAKIVLACAAILADLPQLEKAIGGVLRDYAQLEKRVYDLQSQINHPLGVLPSAFFNPLA